MAESDFFTSLLDPASCLDVDAGDISADSVTAALKTEAPIDPALAIDAARLLALLSPNRFVLDSHCQTSRTLIFSRPSFAADLYESLTLQSAGRRGNVIQVRIGVWFGRHGIVAGQSRLLVELAPTSRTGIVLLQNANETRILEHRVASLAPRAAESFAGLRGHELLLRLGPVKLRVNAYLAALRKLGPDLPRIVSQLMERATPDQLNFALRLLESPGMQRVAEPALYHAAAMTLAVFGEAIEGVAHPFRSGSAAVMRVQLLVHHFLGW